MTKYFIDLIKDCSYSDWAYLSEPDKYGTTMYVLNSEAKTVIDPKNHPDFKVEPAMSWPVRWLLGWHSRKHRFCDGKLPHVKSVLRSVADFNQRLKWRWFFRDESSEVPFRLPARKVYVAPFTHNHPPELAWACSAIYSTVRDCVMKQFRAAKYLRGSDKYWNNTSQLAIFAARILAGSRWAAVPSDKDGGFTLVLKDTLSSRELPADKYEMVHPRVLNNEYSYLLKSYSQLVSKLCKAYECNEWKSALYQGYSRGLRGLAQPVMETVKSHKPPGMVSFRTLHDCSRHTFRGLGIWVSKLLRSRLNQYQHICKDTQVMLDGVKKVAVGPRDLLLKGDVKDLYMTGSHEVLARLASRYVDPSIKGLFEDIVLFLLGSQFVTFDPHQSQLSVLYRVTQGAGMGFNCAGEIADAAFHEIEEFAPQQDSIDYYKIRYYGRCKDDFLCIMDLNVAKCTQFKEQFRQSTAGFDVDKWESSLVGVEFLDAFIYKAEDVMVTNRLTVRVHWKESALGIPLSMRSAHPTSALHEWKFTEIQRCAKNCNTYRDFDLSRSVLLQRLSRHHEDAEMLSLLTNYDPYTARVLRERGGAPKPKSLWLVIPFHPCWQRSGLNKALRALCEQPNFRHWMQHALGARSGDIRLAYKLAGKNLVNLARQWR